MEAADLRQDLNCSICLEVYRDPVTLKCGHNFCLACIRPLLCEQSGFYSCPECRKKFKSGLEPNKNITLSRIAERFHNDHQKETTILCTYCDYPVSAERSCQQCETSMCADHLRKHNKTVEHVLLPPTTELGKRRCPVHGKVMEYYCMEDLVCVCSSCRLDGEHREHLAESLEEASQKKLKPLLEKLTCKQEKIAKKVQNLQECSTKAREIAANVTQRATDKLDNIKKQLEDLEKMVFGEVSRWEVQCFQSTSDVIQQLTTNKNKLSQKISHLESLRDLGDPLTVLQDQELDKDLGDVGEALPNDPEFPDLRKDLILNALCKLSDLVSISKMSIQKPADVLLDVHTAASNLWISDDLKSTFRSEMEHGYPETPERFQQSGVLSCSSFSTWRHYWEVDTSQSDSWRVGMCYPSVNRKNRISMIGQEDDSWCLRRFKDNYNLMHNCKYTDLPCRPYSHKFRIYLDYEAGQLSFYEVGDSIRHLHTFRAIFTKPLHAVLAVFQGSITISK
ncbi:E3 ubiquitin-protein ligase TRIM11-like [Pyxicephalus adspersus]|uniref:Uncharacterized protein n=1 Tax=Pyxicephalus adspersus TaxID=30357 RepID=A0AAV3AZF1_PYXAD|nr:TPA: hypothetical protein GDO54_008106 [Pyxicephalus adspersus]DBA27638.1 TPA: hypothetical protein GDO54_008107 [Pyxicephalus adspersus]